MHTHTHTRVVHTCALMVMLCLSPHSHAKRLSHHGSPTDVRDRAVCGGDAGQGLRGLTADAEEGEQAGPQCGQRAAGGGGGRVAGPWGTPGSGLRVFSLRVFICQL